MGTAGSLLFGLETAIRPCSETGVNAKRKSIYRNSVHIYIYIYIHFFCPMPPHVLVEFVGLPPGHDSSVTDFWGWDADEVQLRCLDDNDDDIYIYLHTYTHTHTHTYTDIRKTEPAHRVPNSRNSLQNVNRSSYLTTFTLNPIQT